MSLTIEPTKAPVGLDPSASIRRLLIAGAIVTAFLTFGVGGWAASTEVAGAVIAQGRIIVESSVKKVQHPTGGVVGDLLVREGQHVKAGDIVLRLDSTQTLAGLDLVRQDIDELVARKARDEAERDDLASIAFPPDLLARRNDARVARLISEEQSLFAIRRAGREGQKSQLKEQIAQLAQESVGAVAEIDAKTKEMYWSKEELKGVQQLWDKKLVEFTKLTGLQRESARLDGERGRLQSSLAELRAKTSEINLKIEQVDQDARTELGKDLADIRGKLSELREKEISAQDQLKRIDLRAPQEGFVHQLAVHTVGGVVTASEPIMLIVPDGDALSIEARVDPNEIDQVHLGQPVIIRFPGLGQRTTPEIDGSVALVSADLSQDEKTGASYYMIRVSMPDEQVFRLGSVKLVPGMPVEVFLETTARTVLSFLLKPMRDQIDRAFREK
jgi:HlyD family secretion protein